MARANVCERGWAGGNRPERRQQHDGAGKNLARAGHAGRIGARPAPLER